MANAFKWIGTTPDRFAMGYVGGAGKKVDAVAKAMRIETEIDATECKQRTPVDTGALRSSIHVVGPSEDGDRLVTAIVAGGPSAPYAIKVHEDLEAFHKVGEAKFIESVVRESAPFIRDRITKRARGLS